MLLILLCEAHSAGILLHILLYGTDFAPMFITFCYILLYEADSVATLPPLILLYGTDFATLMYEADFASILYPVLGLAVYRSAGSIIRQAFWPLA